MRPIATGRVTGIVIAIVGVGVSIWNTREAVRRDDVFHQWEKARPLETAIDLSRPGETTVPFHQTCSTAHGEAIFLNCELPGEAIRNPKELLTELSGSIVITDSTGIEVESVSINGPSARNWDGKILLAQFAPFHTGDYVATIRIDSGVAALADKQPTIDAEYQLCGLEYMPAMLAGARAFGAGVIGLIAALCVLPGLLRCGIWGTTAVDSATGE